MPKAPLPKGVVLVGEGLGGAPATQDVRAQIAFWRDQFVVADANVARYKLALRRIANGCGASDDGEVWEGLGRMQMAQLAHDALADIDVVDSAPQGSGEGV